MIHERGGPSIARWLVQDAAVIAYTELWRELSSAISYAPWRLSRAWRRPLRTRQNCSVSLRDSGWGADASCCSRAKRPHTTAHLGVHARLLLAAPLAVVRTREALDRSQQRLRQPVRALIHRLGLA